MKDMDLDTTAGLAEFVKRADKQTSHRKLRGLGHVSTRTLVERCWYQLVSNTSEDYPQSERIEDAKLLSSQRRDGNGQWQARNRLTEKTVDEVKAGAFSDEWVENTDLYFERYKRGIKESTIDAEVLADRRLNIPLDRLGRAGSNEAKELMNRKAGKHGLADETQLPRYLTILATEAREKGMHAVAEALEKAATVPENAAKYPKRPKGAPKAATVHPGTATAQARLELYEHRIRGKTADQIREIEDEMADKEGRERKLFMKSIKEARDKRADRAKELGQ